MSDYVSFPRPGGTTAGYLARPARAGPAVVVIQEWWGLVPHVERVADRLAAEGFVALAPDLYHGQTTSSPDEAGRLMMSLQVDATARDLDGAIAYLKDQPEVKGSKVGTVGFCMGGALSLFAASRNRDVGACVVFYGAHPNVKPDLAALQAPVLGLYGGRDSSVTPQVVADLDRRLAALGKRHEFHTYPDASHAFFNDTRPGVYDPVASADAWAKTLAFLRRELKAS